MRRYLGLAPAVVLAAISFSALAMGLGEIRLNSYLNQELDAEIELVSAAADEIESLEVSLADEATFERYGLVRDALINSLQFEVIRRPNGTAYIKVTSSEPIREPFITLLVVADWSRGRLMREYTLLLDPPAFAAREPARAPAADVQAPSTREPVEVAEPIYRAPPDLPATEAAPAEETTGDVISIPPLEADAEPVRREAVQAEPELGGSYGPIQRNETLWGIARRLRPDESVTINQMMLALFRANPEAFQGNINRLKAGYILRIPEYGDVTAIARRDAFNEVKRQNEEWRAGSAPAAPSPADTGAAPVEAEPELNLVAPEEVLEPEAGAFGEADAGIGAETAEDGFGSEDPLDLAGDDPDEGAIDLGVEDETGDRLLDLEDESMQALQEQDELLTAEEPAEGVEPVLPEAEPTGEAAEESLDAPVTGEPETAPAEEAAAETQAEAEPAPPVVAPVAPEPTLVEKLQALLFSPLGLGIGAAILVLLLAGVLVMRKRRDAAQATPAAALADWGDDAEEDVTVISGRDEEDATLVTGHDDDEVTMFGHDADEEDAVAGQDKLADTMVGGQAVTLDDNDPLSEADFHMAYGLYDQAAEVVEKAVSRDPSRKDYHAKLAEIHFAANNTEGFMAAARHLKELAGTGDPDWDNVAIMGSQIAPDDPLFAGAGSTASVDLDFTSAADEFAGEESPAPAPAAAPADDTLDFDIALDDSAAPEAPATEEPVAGEAAADGMDFDFDVGGTQSAQPPEPEPAAAGTDTGSDFDFDLGELDTPSSEPAGGADDAFSMDEETPADEAPASYADEQTQSEFDKALEELSAFVDTNLPEQDAGDAVEDTASGELNLDDYSFDEHADGGEDALGTGEDEEDIGEIGTKLDLARAYIDMGDPDGARGILEEVVSDGDAEQQREARELLDQLS